MIVQVDDVGDDSEFKQEVCVGSPPPGDIEVQEAVGQEDQPNKNDDHRRGQTALR